MLVDTIDQVERNYVTEVNRRELIESAIRGVLGKLDPYSSYIGPDELDRFRTSVESEFGGIGIQIAADDGQLQIISPMYGTPAYRAGLLAGDRILEIDGKSTDGLTLDEAVEKLKGDEGTSVTLTDRACRQGGQRKSDAQAREDPPRNRAGRPSQGRRDVGFHARSEAAHRLRAADGVQPRYGRRAAARADAASRARSCAG